MILFAADAALQEMVLADTWVEGRHGKMHPKAVLVVDIGRPWRLSHNRRIDYCQ